MTPFPHLNSAQSQAVITTEGRVLILAGAGSGKTSVLAYRIAYLLQFLHIEPEAILGLTFTNKAAQEMRSRVARIVGSKLAKKLTLSTFHSFCMQLLRKEIHLLGYTNNFTLYTEKEVRRIALQVTKNLLEHEGEIPSLEEALQKIAQIKNKGLNPLDLEATTWHDQFCQELYMRLESCLCAYNAVDFDSLLSLSVTLFEKHKTAMLAYQKRYRYIMIDEYQDTNPIQYRLAEMLSAYHQNLCVVGDDDQSIYGWRGAEIKNILDFASKTIIKLEQNYRSTPTILQAANAVIAHNKQRHNKQLWSKAKPGDLIHLFHAPTELEEAQSVVQRMIKLNRDKKIPWKEMAILYRSNLLARPFELSLMQAVWQKQGNWVRGIPYQVFGGTEFYERAEIKDLLAYLRLIANPLDQEALLRIINTPRRGISDQTLKLLTEFNRKSNIPLWDLLEQIASPLSFALKQHLSHKALNAICCFTNLIKSAKEKFSQLPLSDAFTWLIETIDYKKAIEDEAKSEKMRDFRWENVMYCVDMMIIYEEEKRLNEQHDEISVSDFLSTALLEQKQEFTHIKKADDDKINLITFHSAKGLEFTACFLVGLEDHIIPHEKSLLDTGLEEERRLLYVAMTRAKEHLCLSMARQRKKMGKDLTTNPSRFLLEIPKSLLKISSWQTL